MGEEQQTPGLNAAELIFVQRTLPHFMSGKSPVDAAMAVLEDDARFLSAVADNSHGYLGFNDTSHRFTDAKAVGLRSALSAKVYAALKQVEA